MNWDLENRTVQRAAGDRWWSKRRFQSRFILAFGLRVRLIIEGYTFPLKFLSSASSTLSRSPQRYVAAVDYPVFEEMLQGNALLKHIRWGLRYP